MTTLTQASTQWASRPADERFTSLTDMQTFKHAVKARSLAKNIANRDITVVPVGDDHKGLQAIGKQDYPVNLTNWSFGQLASLAKAPAGYLKTLPSEMAADCVNYGLHHARDVEDVKVLLSKYDGEAEMRAATGPNYGRIWDVDILDDLTNWVGDGVTGRFRVPGEFGKEVTVDKNNTTLYASDRDMFVFLADEKNRIDVPNRRNGETGSMARGFFLWNSEVGAKTFGISTFLFDFVCMNRIVWGADDVQTVTIRHTSGAPHRFLEEAVPALEAYAEGSAQGIEQQVVAAQAKRIDDVDDFLSKRFSGTQVKLIKATHEAEEGRPIETLWDATTGITAVARTIQHQDARVAMETVGGAVMALAA